MADESWSRIYAAPRELRGVGGGRYDTPHVSTPICPDHCSGRHEVEGTFECPHGHGAAYTLVAHEWVWTPGHYFYTREGMNGAPALGRRDALPPCRTCGKALRRT